MQVLMAGMHDLDNQFGRALRRYPGVEVIHTSPDPGEFTADADAVVIVKCQLSHQKFWDVKAAYKGKPVFITDLSFSPIKERFEKFLADEGMKVPGKPDGILAQAFKTALSPKTPTPALKPAPEERTVMKHKKHRPEMLAKINQTIIECTNAGMGTTEVLEFLEHEGLRKASGESFRRQDIDNKKFQLRQQGRMSPGGTRAAPVSAEKKPRLSTPASSTADQQLELIGKVMKSMISANLKIDLVERIQRGELTHEETPFATKVQTDLGPRLRIQVQSIYNSEPKPLVTIDKFQAVGILKLFTEIKKFADD